MEHWISKNSGCKGGISENMELVLKDDFTAQVGKIKCFS